MLLLTSILLLKAISIWCCASCNDKYELMLNGAEDLDIDELFQFYTRQGKSLVNLEENAIERKDVFEQNVKSIILHNSDKTQTYKRGIDRHTAMTFDEIKAYYHLDEVNQQAAQKCSATSTEKGTDATLQRTDAPSSFDWRDHMGVSPVKDQGNCGSCWTFSTVGCLESAHLIKYGSLATYAEQQLVDCAGDYENYGCNGGLPSQAFEYIHAIGGLASEESYPYFAANRNCTVTQDDFAISVMSGSVNITAGDEEELKNAVYFYGPTSVCFEVVDGFGSYKTGVYSSTTCKNSQQDVNHAVLAVGYGTNEDGVDYWIIKNSWSDEWGDGGFFKMKRGANMCGIAMCNSHPADVTVPQVAAFT